MPSSSLIMSQVHPCCSVCQDTLPCQGWPVSQYVGHILFIRSSTWGQSSCPLPLTTVIRTRATNVSLTSGLRFFCTYTHKGNCWIYSNPIFNLRHPLIEALLLFIPTHSAQGFQFLHVFTNTCSVLTFFFNSSHALRKWFDVYVERFTVRRKAGSKKYQESVKRHGRHSLTFS